MKTLQGFSSFRVRARSTAGKRQAACGSNAVCPPAGDPGQGLYHPDLLRFLPSMGGSQHPLFLELLGEATEMAVKHLACCLALRKGFIIFLKSSFLIILEFLFFIINKKLHCMRE